VVLLQLPQSGTDLARLTVFWVFEFGVMFGLVGARLRGSAIWWAALAMMFVLPLMRFGAANDLAMRAVIPAQVALYLMVCWTLAAARRPWRSLQAAGLVVVLVLGSGSVVHTFWVHGRADLAAVKLFVSSHDWRAARASVVKAPAVAWRDDPTYNVFYGQYFGDSDSFFYRVLSSTNLQPRVLD
jgi:hypothetical protein